MNNKLAFPLLAVAIAYSGISHSSQADASDSSRISVTTGYSGQRHAEKVDQALQSKTPDIMPELSTQGFRSEAKPAAKALAAHPCNCISSDMYIATASTSLVKDWDADGFYHRFTIHFDTNIDFGQSQWVYAKLYLSLEGGPWNLYASSDDFLIEGDSRFDDYTVETELLEAYPAGYYDVRIDIHDADNNDWLLSHGPYDDPSLSALPLEDQERDDAGPHHGHSSSGGGGATGMGLLLVLGLVGLTKHITKKASPA